MRRVLAGLLLCAIVGAVGVSGAFVYFAFHLPKFDSLHDYQPLVSTRVIAADGTTVAEYYRERRTVVAFNDIPDVMVKAMISAEDKTFFEHGGVSFLGMLRAAVVDVVRGKRAQGASTITQQIVRTLLLTNEKRISRKMKEILLAYRIEKSLSKEDILWLYLNQIDFGQSRYGIEEASRFYFGVHARDLTLAQASVLAGLPQSPERLSPRRHPEAAKRRQAYVLGRMAKNGYITAAQAATEIARPLQLSTLPDEPTGAAYIEDVRRTVVAKYGAELVETGGLTIEIAMVPSLQRAAEHALQEGLRAVDKRQGWRGAHPLPDAKHPAKLELEHIYAGTVTRVTDNMAEVRLALASGEMPFSTLTWARPFNPASATAHPKTARDVLHVNDNVFARVIKLSPLTLALEQEPRVQGAFVAIDVKTRDVVALVGAYDSTVSAFNRATQAHRQPGSAFKAILYTAAIDLGKYTPVSRVDDSPELVRDADTGQTWKPQNFEKDEFDGPMSLRRALAESKNTVAVKLLQDLGLARVRLMATALGMTSDIPSNTTAALGTGEVVPLELTNAYATLAAQGVQAAPVLIRRVIARDGQVLEDHTVSPTDPSPAVRPAVAFVATDLLRSVIDDPAGTAHRLAELGRPAAGKTGTAAEHRDAWFVGFTPSLCAGSWVGFDDHQMLGTYETGGHAAGPIWLAFMKAATAGKPVEDFAVPPGVVQLKVNFKSGLLAADGDTNARLESFVAGTEPTQMAGPSETAPPDDFFR